MNIGDMVVVRNDCRRHNKRFNTQFGWVAFIDIALVHPIAVRFEGVENKDAASGCFYFKEDDLFVIGKEDSATVNHPPVLKIKNVYFNDPVTVVIWNDGTKTIVRCSENDFYDPEKGLAMAIIKKIYGNDNSFHKIFKKWLPKEDADKSEAIEGFFETLRNLFLR